MAAQQQIKREDNDCRKQPLHDDLRSQHVIGDGVAGGPMGTRLVRSGLLPLLPLGRYPLARPTATAHHPPHTPSPHPHPPPSPPPLPHPPHPPPRPKPNPRPPAHT